MKSPAANFQLSPARQNAGSEAAPASSFGIQTFRRRTAFTLVEVMIAMFIFFMAVFTILGLIANALRNARSLQRSQVDCSMMAGLMASTNRLDEGPLPPEVIGAFEETYHDFSGDGEVTEVLSNSLFQVDLIVQSHSPNAPVSSKMAILLYKPGSPPGRLTRGGGGVR